MGLDLAKIYQLNAQDIAAYEQARKGFVSAEYAKSSERYVQENGTAISSAVGPLDVYARVIDSEDLRAGPEDMPVAIELLKQEVRNLKKYDMGTPSFHETGDVLYMLEASKQDSQLAKIIGEALFETYQINSSSHAMNKVMGRLKEYPGAHQVFNEAREKHTSKKLAPSTSLPS